MKNYRIIIILLGILLLSLCLVIIFFITQKNIHKYAQDMVEVRKETCLNLDILDFMTKGEVYYIYKKNFLSSSYLNVYGFMTEQSIETLSNNETFHILKSPGAEYVHLGAELPDNLIDKMNISRESNSFGILNNSEGNIIILNKVCPEYNVQIKISDSSGAFALQLNSPPR